MARMPSLAEEISLRLYLLRAFRIERDTRPIALPTRKVESLLAYLALFPEPHPREKLAALLWGDSTDEQARHSLRSALTTLRTKLGDDLLLADRETVQLNPDCPLWVDAREIQKIGDRRLEIDHLQSLISLYQGDLLPDLYDDWVLVERERLRQLYLDALVRLAQELRSQSQHARAIEFARKALATEPTNETAHRQLMACLAATGDRIGALKQYDECQKKLRGELGVEPSSETVALRDQIERELTGLPSREALLTNVPTPLTSFVGRLREVAEIKRLLDLTGLGNLSGLPTRLLTLTGAGGCGKTRLAIQVATDLASRDVPAERLYKHGVWWMELAALSDPELVPKQVAHVFELPESLDVPLTTTLANHFRSRQVLLVLDNCEHLIEACAQLAETLLSACPSLQILATSREALGITGEMVWYVPSLESPDPQHLPPLESLAQYDAIRLLTERAQSIVPHWSLAEHAEAAARICCRLDGIPLAIELAAARLKVLAAEQVAERLDDRFQLLTGGSRTALPRHRTLRATIDWSYDLLSDEERVLFQRLAIFAGGCTLAGVESVCSGNGLAQDDVLDVLTRLVDKSIVIVECDQNERRYRMLETIRQYAHEKLIESGELPAMQDRHLDYFLKLAEEAYPHLFKGIPAWLRRLETEHDNLRVALQYALAQDTELALRLAMSLEYFWMWHNHYIEGHAWTSRLLTLTEAWGPGKLRARALGLAGSLATDIPGDQSARALLESSVEMARMAGDTYQTALSLANLGWSAHQAGDWAQVRRCAEESQALYRELGIAWGVVNAHWLFGMAASGSGDYALARPLFEQTLELARKENLPGIIVVTLNQLGDLAQRRGNYANAGELYAECAQLCRQLGMKDWVANQLAKLGQVALHEGDHVRARLLFEQALAIYQQLELADRFVIALAGLAGVAGVAGKHLPSARSFGAVEAIYGAQGWEMIPAARALYDRIIALVRSQLDEATFNAAWAEGRKMTLEQAIEYALKA